MDSAPSPRMLAVFDAYTEYIEDTRYECALPNAADERPDHWPGLEGRLRAVGTCAAILTIASSRPTVARLSALEEERRRPMQARLSHAGSR